MLRERVPGDLLDPRTTPEAHLFAPSILARTQHLVRGVPDAHAVWVHARGVRGFAEPVAMIALGGCAYGAAIGAWNDQRLAAYVAVKLPVLLVLTALVNALLNALWARRFGLDLTFAQSLRSVLLAFGLAAIVLGSLAPIVLFLGLALPGPDAAAGRLGHNVLGLAHVAFVGWTGVLVVKRQLAWLATRTTATASGNRVVLAWLLVNLIVGAQISWNLRPWFGTPGMSVQFLRPEPFDGNFYESLYKMVVQDPR